MSSKVTNKLKSMNRRATFGLQLTAMVDMFTILLVFLLKSYSTSSVTINPADGIRLPGSTSYTNAVEALRLVVSTKGIYVDDEQVVAIENGEIGNEQVDENDPMFIRKLYEKLNKQALKSKKISSENSEVAFDGKIIMQADKRLNYGILRKVMYTSTMAGYSDFKLATVSVE